MNKQKILLVVDDEKGFRKVLAKKLEKLDYKIYQAGDGEEGFRIAEEMKPDLVISDIVMPKMDGNQLLKALRMADFGKNTPFVVITAREAMRDYFEVIGVEAFFKKPFKLQELTDKIAEILGEGKDKKDGGKGKDTEVSVQQEAVIKKTILDVERKAYKAPIIAEEKKSKDQRKGQSRIHQPTRKADKAPIIAEEKKPKDQREGQSQIHQPTEKKILIFETERLVYKALENNFSKYNCTTGLVLTRDECIKEAKREQPDVILIRSNPGSFNSEKFASKLKKMPVLDKIPVIIYKDIGKIAGSGGTSEKEMSFQWNAEGKVLLKRICDLLEIK